jgi:hypothetical protein
MGRPAKLENEKLRSFSVRLAPRSMGRILKAVAVIDGIEEQEIIRDLLDEPLEELWKRKRPNGWPSRSEIAVMDEDSFRRLLALPDLRTRKGKGRLRTAGAEARA